MNSEKPSKTKRIVLVGGCFDILHYGHIDFLTRAAALGDRLVVALESDENVRRLKNDKRPIHPQQWRKDMLSALRVVNEVIALGPMKTDQDYRTLVARVRPAVIAVTQGDPMIEKKREHAASIGARVVAIPKVHTPSTSQLAKLIGLE